MKIKELAQQSFILEKELLSLLLRSPFELPKIRTFVNEKDFYSFSLAFQVIANALENQKNVVAELMASKISISQFVDHSSLRTVEDICKDIKENNTTRNLVFLLEDSLKNIPITGIAPYVADLQQRLITNLNVEANEQGDIKSLIISYLDQQNFYKEKFLLKDGIIGISTGYKKLDAVIDGLRPGHLWVIGGYTNMGKTAASLNIAAHLIKNGKRVVFYSLEMSKIDILSRLLGIMTAQSGLKILKGYPHDVMKVKQAMDLLTKSDMVIYNEKTELSEIYFSMLEENIKKPVDLFVVDFIQNVTVKGSMSEYETITNTILSFQKLSKKINVPFIVLSQISNEGAKNNNDVVMSFKGTGAIAAAADLAIEIKVGEDDRAEWKRKMNEGQQVNMKWDIRKNRHGKVGFIDMTFDGFTGIFRLDQF